LDFVLIAKFPAHNSFSAVQEESALQSVTTYSLG